MSLQTKISGLKVTLMKGIGLESKRTSKIVLWKSLNTFADMGMIQSDLDYMVL